MTLEIFFNILIIVLLVIGIIYAILLEYRLSTAKGNSRELSLLIEHFYKASQKIGEELAHLKELEEQAQAELKINLECARLVQDELTTLMNEAERKLLSGKSSHVGNISSIKNAQISFDLPTDSILTPFREEE